ncbi:MAG: hypothetical protein JJT78_02255 [Leptospira sp.]|nr:hypothetical protein [Leptospira sp.]
MPTKKRLKLIRPFWYLTLLVSCTFGSVGNSLEEEAIILENFIRLVREVPGTFQPIIHSYDDQNDQVDDDLSTFNLSSGSGGAQRTYSIEILQTNSFLDIERMDFRFNPPDKPFGSLNARTQDQSAQVGSRTHTPFTIPLDLPPNDPYAQVYSAPGFRINPFMIGNSPGSGLGTVARNPLPALRDAPQGILAQSRVIIRRWDLNVRITDITDPPPVPPDNTRNLRISFRDYEETLLPRCKTEVLRGQSTEWVLGLNYSRLFRDIPAQGVQVLNTIFNDTSGNPTQTIQITDISPYYSWFFTNLEADDAVLIQESCLL